MNFNGALVNCYKTIIFLNNRASQPCRSFYNATYSQKLYKCTTTKQKIRCYGSDEKKNKDFTDDHAGMKNRAGTFGKRSSTLGGVVGKYKIFQDSDSPVILDVDEERQMRLEQPELFNEVQPQTDPFAGMNVERGESGVFEIEELVEVLRNENAKNLITIAIPPEFQYVDYMIILTAKSRKHAYSLAEFVRKLFKRKMHDGDIIPVIEGGKANDWLAMDMGNIALHIFTEQERQRLDIETLWLVGADYDSMVNEKDDEYIQLLKEHTHPSLSGIEPVQSPKLMEDKSG